jgi:hypothetical protein
MRRNVSRLACSLLFVCAASAANADPIFAGFPAPGVPVTAFTPAPPVGSPPQNPIGLPGGGTPTWGSPTAIDLSATDQLWWGPTAVQLGYRILSTNTNVLSTSFTLDPTCITCGFGTSTERWIGTVTLPNGGSPVTLDARFTAQIMNGASNWIDPSGVSIPTSGFNSTLAVVEITASSFQINELFEVRTGPSTWTPFLTYYNGPSYLHNTDEESRMVVQGGFYYTPVPGPIVGAGLPGLVLAALSMVGLARRRRQLVA